MSVSAPYYGDSAVLRTPPPDLPSLLLKERIVYLGLPLFSDDDAKRQMGIDVTELIIAQLLYLEFDNPEKPIFFYINSTGTSWYSGDAIGFETEAFAIADEIGVMQDGRIVQWDTAWNLYHRPVNRLVANFVGQGAFIPARVLNDHQVEIELGILEGDIPPACHVGCDVCSGGCTADVLLRPDDVVHDDASPLQAEVIHKAFRGAEILYTLKLQSGRKVLAMVPSHHNHATGERIGIRLDVDHVVAFAPEHPNAAH